MQREESQWPEAAQAGVAELGASRKGEVPADVVQVAKGAVEVMRVAEGGAKALEVVSIVLHLYLLSQAVS